MDQQRKAAVALRYRAEQDLAPRVVAQGQGFLAERILALAQENGVPIYEDGALVEALAQLDLGTEIPEHLYKVIAEILVFVYSLDQSQGQK